MMMVIESATKTLGALIESGGNELKKFGQSMSPRALFL